MIAVPASFPADAVWRKSSHSNGDGNVCVEVAFVLERTALRDSKNPKGTVLVLPEKAWRQFRQALAGL
jgi:hypothetical protein